MNMTMGARLQEALDRRQRDAASLISSLGMSKGAIYNILNDITKPDKVQALTAYGISRELQISLGWLLFDEGSWDDSGSSVSQLKVAPEKPPAGHVVLDYLVGFGQLPGPRFVVLPDSLVQQRIGFTPLEDVRWVQAPSVSMSPEIERGALVLVDSTATKPEQFIDGNVYAYSVWGSPGILRRAYVRKGRYEFRGVTGEEAHASDIHFEDVPKHLKVFGMVLGAINPK